MPVNNTTWNRIRYNAYAPFYNRFLRSFRKYRQQSLTWAAPKDGERILVMGCGPGPDFEFLQSHLEIHACDLSPEMVKLARREAEKRKFKNISIREMNVQELDYPDSYFDLIVAHLIFAIVPDPQAAAREAARVLKNSGRIVVFDKFLAEDNEPSLLRKSLNIITNILATNINRKLSDITEPAELTVEMIKPVYLRGNFKVVLLTKSTREPVPDP